MGKLKAVIFGVAGAVITSVVAQLSGACPDLLSQMPALITASIGAAAAYLMPKAGGAKATLAGVAGALFAGTMQQLTAICGASFVEQLPALIAAGVWLGLGAYFTAHRAKV